MNKSLLISHPARLSTHTAKPSRSWVLTTAQIEQRSERGQSREKGRLFGELLEALLKHGKRKAIWSSKVGRERAPFHSRACRKMARNGLAGNSKQTLKSSGVCRSSQWPPRRGKAGWRGHATRAGVLLLCTLLSMSWWEQHIATRSCCHGSFQLETGHGSIPSGKWEAGGRPPCPHSCWVVLPHGGELSVTRSWLNLPSSFILMP